MILSSENRCSLRRILWFSKTLLRRHVDQECEVGVYYRYVKVFLVLYAGSSITTSLTNNTAPESAVFFIEAVFDLFTDIKNVSSVFLILQRLDYFNCEILHSRCYLTLLLGEFFRVEEPESVKSHLMLAMEIFRGVNWRNYRLLSHKRR